MPFASDSELGLGQFRSMTGASEIGGVPGGLVALGEWRIGIQAGRGRGTDSVVRRMDLTALQWRLVVFAAPARSRDFPENSAAGRKT